tara:strand:- start:112 stop:510 length:399 start_codon:yes stop_codon:yes gene_type:complete
MSLFLYTPRFSNSWSRYFTLFLIFVVAYIAMAWYDFFFGCSLLPLKRSKYSLTGLFKPNREKDDTQRDDVTTVENKRLRYLVYFSHLLFIVPLLLYIIVKKNKVGNGVYSLLGALAILTALYHGGKLMTMSH